MAEGRKSWAGTSIDERRAARRAALLDAALGIVAESGAAGLTVRAACRASALTERYFYENFADREALLVAVHDMVATDALTALGTVAGEVAAAAGGDLSTLDQAQTESMTASIVHAFTSHLLDDPRRARVLLTESFADPILAERGLASVPNFAAITAAAFEARWPGSDPTDAALNGRATVGALVHLYLGWMRGELDIDRGRLERHAVALILGFGPVSSSD